MVKTGTNCHLEYLRTNEDWTTADLVLVSAADPRCVGVIGFDLTPLVGKRKFFVPECLLLDSERPLANEFLFIGRDENGMQHAKIITPFTQGRVLHALLMTSAGLLPAEDSFFSDGTDSDLKFGAYLFPIMDDVRVQLDWIDATPYILARTFVDDQWSQVAALQHPIVRSILLFKDDCDAEMDYSLMMRQRFSTVVAFLLLLSVEHTDTVRQRFDTFMTNVVDVQYEEEYNNLVEFSDCFKDEIRQFSLMFYGDDDDDKKELLSDDIILPLRGKYLAEKERKDKEAAELEAKKRSAEDQGGQSNEDGAGPFVPAKKRKCVCKRCGGEGHYMKTCKAVI
jgi:hypothetical protein